MMTWCMRSMQFMQWCGLWCIRCSNVLSVLGQVYYKQKKLLSIRVAFQINFRVPETLPHMIQPRNVITFRTFFAKAWFVVFPIRKNGCSDVRGVLRQTPWALIPIWAYSFLSYTWWPPDHTAHDTHMSVILWEKRVPVTSLLDMNWMCDAGGFAIVIVAWMWWF